jgi:hypothetical protein
MEGRSLKFSFEINQQNVNISKVSCRPHLISFPAEAKSDLVNVLSRLEGHWVVLEAELVEINKDISYCETCIQKYGYTYQF